MRKIGVYYYDMSNYMFMGSGTGYWSRDGGSTPLLDNYEKVTVMEVPDTLGDLSACELAFMALQRIDSPNELLDARGLRSMSVGDLCVVDGRTYLCGALGFTEVNADIEL